MQPRILLLAALTLFASACGPTIIGASTPPEDASADTSTPPTTDVPSPPPRIDVPVPPSSDVPSPPPLIDGGRPDVAPPPPGAFLRTCLAFCARGNVVCMTTLDCNRQCEMAASQREIQQCPAEVAAYITCALSRSAYTCQRDRNTFDVDSSQCSAELTAFTTCLRGSPPPPIDGGPPPIDVLPPPPDASSPIFAACQRACERQSRDCATGARCEIDCASVESSVPARCVPTALRVLECFASNGFVCSMGSASPSPTCRAISDEVQRCISGSPPTPIDGGPTPVDVAPPPPDAPVPVTRACSEACALARRACMNDQPSCETGCSSVPSMLPPACGEPWNTYLACVVRNGFTCVGGSARASTLCDSASAAVSRCAMGMTTPGDAGVAPPPNV